MVNVGLSPGTNKLIKQVNSAFHNHGWKIGASAEETHDFRVEHNSLGYFVKCVSSSAIDYKSELALLKEWESYTRLLRRTRQLIIVLEWNFLSIPLNQLHANDVFAISAGEISLATSLAEMSKKIPTTQDERQLYLLERCVKYATFVSQEFLKKENFPDAISWAKLAVQHSQQFNFSYYNLFSTLIAAGQIEAAAELGAHIANFRPKSPAFFQSLVALETKLGRETQAARWRERQKEMTLESSRTLEDILAKQRRNPPAECGGYAGESNQQSLPASGSKARGPLKFLSKHFRKQ